jgi:hypothetical protein
LTKHVRGEQAPMFTLRTNTVTVDLVINHSLSVLTKLSEEHAYLVVSLVLGVCEVSDPGSTQTPSMGGRYSATDLCCPAAILLPIQRYRVAGRCYSVTVGCYYATLECYTAAEPTLLCYTQRCYSATSECYSATLRCYSVTFGCYSATERRLLCYSATGLLGRSRALCW